MTKQANSDQAIAMRVSVISIVANVVLSVFKLLAGVLANSGAMISDAIHSASDVFSTFIVIAGVKISAKAPDKEHPYGHERMECIAAIVLAVILALTGAGIGYSGIQKIMEPSELEVPGLLAMVAAVISIAVKEWQYWFTRAAAKKINSGALMADAWHHRSDALSSVGALVGIAGARMGFPVLDPVASVVICLFILKAAYEVFKDAGDKLVDKACDDDVVKTIDEIVAAQEKANLDVVRTRMFASRIYVEMEISVDKDMLIAEAHRISREIRDAVEARVPEVKHCLVHVNPAKSCV